MLDARVIVPHCENGDVHAEDDYPEDCFDELESKVCLGGQVVLCKENDLYNIQCDGDGRESYCHRVNGVASGK